MDQCKSPQALHYHICIDGQCKGKRLFLTSGNQTSNTCTCTCVYTCFRLLTEGFRGKKYPSYMYNKYTVTDRQTAGAVTEGYMYMYVYMYIHVIIATGVNEN